MAGWVLLALLVVSTVLAVIAALMSQRYGMRARQTD